MADNNVRDNPQRITAFTLGSMAFVGLLRLLPYLLPIPYPWNAAPVGALGIYGGARLGFWSALTVPLVLMAGTDLLIWGLHDWSSQWLPFDPWVYAALMVSVVLGLLLRHSKSPWRIGACTLLAGAQFFLVTNLGAWLSMSKNVDPNEMRAGQSMILNADGYPIKYARNAEGLMMAYVMGAKFSPPKAPLGFALPMFVSNVLFAALLFSAHSWAARRGGRSVLTVAQHAEVVS